MTRVITRGVKLLRRVRQSGPGSPTLHFTFPGSLRRSRSNLTFVGVEHVPAFEGEQAWFEMEKVAGKPWAYWRAVRRVEPPERSRPRGPL